MSAGGGKTYMGLMRFLLYVDDPHFIGFVIRKNATDLRGAGGAFDEAEAMFSKYDPKLKVTKQPMQMTFSSGAKIYFTGLDGKSGMDALQGKQISAILLDEATHFTEEEIVWAESRLRTKANMNPNIWLTCNPDMSSVIFTWIKDFYLYPKGTVIDGELVEGRAIPEKDGVVRYYLKVGNTTEWGESKEELISKFGHRFPKNKETGETTASPKSFTFISATCLDNPPMLEANPDYVSTLSALPRVTRERLLFGSWLAREEGSGYFKRSWTPINKSIDIFNGDEVVRRVRAWDLASTLPSEAYPDPDYTVGVLIARTRSGYYVVEDMVRGRWRAGELESMLVEQTRKDIEMYGYNCTGYLPVEPASAGKIMKHHMSRVFAQERVPIKFFKVGSGKSKLDRFLPFASVAENGLVKIKEDDWNEDFLTELELFTGTRSKIHDDIVDATSDAYNLIATTKELPRFNANKLRVR
ncbi:large subunit terminase [Vibrio phage vB_VhaM_VH-8]|nr:large subunit terminase [Vibrio phage vB_VhaM_VH-8]